MNKRARMSGQSGWLHSLLGRVLVLVLLAGAAVAAPAGASEGELDPRSTPPDERPLDEPSVTAEAKDGKVKVQWRDAPKDAVGFTVARAAGGDAEILADDVGGSRFSDLEAPAGELTYTVSVSRVSDDDAGDVQVGDVLGAATVTVAEVELEAAQAPKEPKVKEERASGSPSDDAGVSATSVDDEAAVGPLAHFPAACEFTGTLAATQTWSPGACPSGYYITGGDLTVPAGRTLTMASGTTVYFDSGLDLVVEGSLIVSGSSTNKVLFTSINANPFDTGGSPGRGDWGSILFENGGTGGINHAEVVWGSSISADGSTPTISNTTVRQMDFGPLTSGSAVEFYNVPHNGTVSLSNITLHDVNRYGVGVDTNEFDASTITVNVSGSDLRSNYPLWVYHETDAVRARATVNVTDSTLQETDGNTALWVDVEHYGVGASSLVTVNLTNATIRTRDGWGYGLDLYAYSDTANASIVVNATNSSLASYDEAIYADADSNGGSGAIDITLNSSEVIATSSEAIYAYAEGDDGDARVTVNATGSTVKSADDDALYLEAYAYGATGAANIATTLTNTTLHGDGDGVYQYADSDFGAASSTTTLLQGSHIRADDDGVDSYAYGEGSGATGLVALSGASTIKASDEAVYLYVDDNDGGHASGTVTLAQGSVIESYDYRAIDVYTESEDDGNATTTVTVVGNSKVVGGDSDGMELDAYAYGDGNATVNVTLSNSTFDAYEEFVDAYTYSDGAGDSTIKLTMAGSSVISYYDAFELDSYADGTGDALIDVTITNSTTLVDDYVVDAYADAEDGDATVLVNVTDATLRAQDDILELGADAGGAGNALVRVNVLRSLLESIGGDVIELDVYSWGTGNATGWVDVTSSTVRQIESDNAIEMDVYANGTAGNATARGTFNGATIRSQYEAVYWWVESANGNAVASPLTVTNSHIESMEDAAFDIGAEGQKGRAQVTPTVTNTTVKALDTEGMDLYANGGPGGTVIAPVVSGGRIDSGDGVYLYAEDWNAAGGHAGDVHVGGSFTSTVINAPWDYGVYAYASNENGAAATKSVVDTKVVNTPIDSYDGTYFYSYGNNADAQAAPEVRSTSAGRKLESYWYYGVYAEADSNNGSATNNTVVRNMAISSYNEGVYIEADADDDGSAKVQITDNVIDDRYEGGDEGIDVNVYGSNATLTGLIANNVITGRDDEGIDVYISAGGTETMDLTISGNTVQSVGGEGIYVEADGGAADGSVKILKNTVRNTSDDGIYVYGVTPTITGNQQSGSGYAGVYVESAPGIGTVSCNTIVGNTVGVDYWSNSDDPVTKDNNFRDGAGRVNGPHNLASNTVGALDASSNWWGSTDQDAVDASIDAGGAAVTTAPLRTSPSSCALPPSTSGGGGGGFAGGGEAPTPLPSAEDTVEPGGTVSTLPEGAEVNDDETVAASVTSPTGGTVSITVDNDADDSTDGFSMLGVAVDITAPDATVEDPLILAFWLDASLLEGIDPMTVTPFRNGVAVADCTGAGATPDPCVESRSLDSNGDLVLVVRTSAASLWTFGVAVDEPSPPPAPPAPPEPGFDAACPAGSVPSAGFVDVPAGNVHAGAIDCVAWWQIAQGTSAASYSPAANVSRAQMASFLGRMLDAAGVQVASSGAYFTDVVGNTHEDRINQLAEAGIVLGITATTYGPDQQVTRAQMASFLVRTYEFIADELAAGADAFGDDDGNTHEANINKAAGAGFARGTSSTTFAPLDPVRRDQMASFLARVLDRLVQEGAASRS